MTNGLPPGWELARIGDVAQFVRGVTYSKAHSAKAPSGGLVPVLRANNIGDGLNYDDLVFVPARFVSDEQIVRDGDVVLAMSSGSKSVVGKAAVAKSPIRCGFGAFCGVIRPSEIISHSLLAYYFQTKAYRNAVSEKSKGVNINNLKAEHILDRPLPIPPLAEQARIASRIDELFSRIEGGERALERAQILVERYCQTVLKAAVTGELTRTWREKRTGKFELGEALLSRVLNNRRADWEKAELAKMRAKGIAPENAKWKQRYPEPTDAKIGIEEVLPESWAQLSLEQATRAERPIAYGVLQPGAEHSGGVPMVRVCDVSDGSVDLTNLKKIAPSISAQFPRTLLQGGEVLITLVGTIGRTAIVPDALAGANVARAVGVLAPVPEVLPDWLELCLRSEKARQALSGNAREVARKTLNVEQLREFAVPIPSMDEQREAVSRVSELLSRARSAADAIGQQLRYAAALRQATLKSAFLGRLVTQQADDEPASILVERIAINRESTPTRSKRGAKQKKAISK